MIRSSSAKNSTSPSKVKFVQTNCQIWVHGLNFGLDMQVLHALALKPHGASGRENCPKLLVIMAAIDFLFAPVNYFPTDSTLLEKKETVLVLEKKETGLVLLVAIPT